ncbi:hypothetical protein ACFLFF_30340 [Brevibacillus reuszeri]|uniref:DUF4376 domain-containing protein n=1 Tax=Brevibacillus reuszeri TaxID=54915 RepID=UPI00366BBF67
MYGQVYRIDQDGFFVEAVLVTVEDIRNHENGILPFENDIVLEPPPQGIYKLKWSGVQWIEDRPEEEILTELKTAKIEEVKQKANETILAGFKSSALGAEHSYSFDFEAQINLLGIKGLLADDAFPGMPWSTWEQGDVLHSREQLQTLWDDGMQHKLSIQQRYWELKRQIEVATTRGQIVAIEW